MFDFFIDTYREVVKGEDVEAAKRLKREKEKAEKIIYPKDVKIVTYTLAVLYLIAAIASMIFTIKYQGVGASVAVTIYLIIVDLSIIVCLSRKTKKGEIAAIILSIVFALSLYGTSMLLPILVR